MTSISNTDTDAPSLWAIGDIHGENAKLSALLDALPRGPRDVTVFLGDYIDRGPDSRGVVQRVLAEHDAAPDRTVLLWGNHEDMAAGYFHFPAPSNIEYDSYDWFRNGGLQAMESWGITKPTVFAASCPDELARLFSLLRTFYRPDPATFPDLARYIFVHAGILPGVEPENASGDMLLWVRSEFLFADDTSGRVVVHGHTPLARVRALPDKIGLDTGAVFGGALTALELPARRVYQVADKGAVVVSDLPAHQDSRRL